MRRGLLLQRYGLSGPDRERGLDAIASAAALVCDAPYGFVSVLDDEREWVKGRYGANVGSVSPASAFCELVVRNRATSVTEDALAHPELADDPLVAGAFGIRFHVGVPLFGADGEVLGSLCVLDTEPREVTAVQLEVLERLAVTVSAQFAARLERSDTERGTGSEHRLALESLPVGYARTDLHGVIRDANPEFSRIVGQPLPHLLGRRAPALQLTTDGDSARIRKDLADLVSGRQAVVRAHRTYQHADGTVVPIFVTTALTRDEQGLPNGFLGFMVDVSAQQELRLSQERFRTGFMSSPIGMALLTTERVFVEVNDRLCEIFGYERDELIGTSIESLMEPDEVTDLHRRFDLAEETGGWQWRAERTYLGKDGRRIVGQVSAARIDDGAGGHLMLGHVEDVTSQRNAEHELVRRSLHDDLTELGNRALLEEQLSSALGRAAAQGRPLAVLKCDLDGFGLVNEALGHRAADVVLRLTADRLRLVAPRGSTLARVGGDEFVIVAEDTDEAGADALVARLEEHLSDPLVVHGEEVLVTASTGVCVHHPDGDPPEVDELLHRAGQALRRAKAAGKNQHTVFDIGLHLEAGRRRTAEAALRHALLSDQIEVVYQPVVHLGTGRVRGAEALCRLRTPDGELVSPALFIDIAEENGSIGALGHLVLERAVRQCALWQAAGRTDLHVAVNVSASQTAEKGYAAGVLAVLRHAGLSPKHLVLELTESALIDASPATVTALESLKAAGVGIAIDDFGTGYASLRYVQQLPVSALKIDISFTGGLPHGRQEQAIVRAVAQLARTLELDCIAEGIETPEQRAFLAELGVCGQGYLLGRPGPAQDVLLLDS